MIERIKSKLTRFSRLDASVEIQRRASLETLHGVNFLNAIRGGSWLDGIGFYPGGWAADYRFLTLLFRLLNDIKPTRILEFGMGETTKMLSAYASNLNPDSRAFTVEHNPQWIEFFGRNAKNLRGIDIVKVEMEKRKMDGEDVNRYVDLFENLPAGEKFDLLLIDGPIGSPVLSRYEMCEVIERGLLASEFIILLDDAHRPGEKQTILEAEKILTKNKIPFGSATIAGAAKEIYAAYSPQFSFIRSI